MKMAPFAERIKKLLLETDYLQPKTRAVELVNNFIKPGLEDLCVSRTSFTWGIPVTFDPKHVVYVWVDALSNYISALGYENNAYHDFDKYWPADVHMVAKDIMREMALGADSSFSNEIMINRINSDLANGLGNLVSRTVAMVDKYFGGTLPTERQSGEFDEELIAAATGLTAKLEGLLDQTQLNHMLAEIFQVVSRANKYIDETAPWALAKDEANKPRLESVLYHLCEALRVSGILLNAYLPSTAPKMMDQLGLDASALDLSKTVYGAQETYTVHKGDALFPRIDVAKEIAHLKEEDEKRKAAAEAASKAKAEAEKKAAAPAEENGVDFTHEEEIDFDTFCKVELRVAEVRACENLKESKKLLHLTVFDGERERCILSGIAKWFKPEDLIGKKIGIVCNLAPRPMMKGKYVSEGMIFAADTADGGCSIAFYGDDTPVGSRIH